ncbi:MAG TPA: ribonuclease III [Chthonomonadaceae bacterium]|nr:ribonuclease III [Chthonomonadaceae bacterium]
MDEDALTRLQERLGVRFREVSCLERALTHRSAASENTLDSNERLEFLGDSVVGLVVCENLYRLYPNHSEGELAKSKAYVVSEASLAQAAQAMGLEEFVVMSSGEAQSGGRRRRSILADAFEAVIAAIYLDRGIHVARRVIRNALMPAIRAAAIDQHRGDYKSSLQEQTQALLRQTPCYRILNETGHEHDKTFLAQAVLGETIIGEGKGKSKKEAEQSAAQDALTHLPERFPPPPASPEERAENG